VPASSSMSYARDNHSILLLPISASHVIENLVRRYMREKLLKQLSIQIHISSHLHILSYRVLNAAGSIRSPISGDGLVATEELGVFQR